MRPRHYTWLLWAALLLAGCGKIDDLSSEDAASWCDFPIGGEAARVAVERWRDRDGRVSLSVDKYDARGNVLLQAVDSGDDERFEQVGTPFEQLDTTYWSYDEGGNWTARDYDFGSDGSIEERAYRQFDDEGNLTEEGLDQDGDGAWDTLQRTEYDEGGHWISEHTDSDGDGDWDVVITATWDEEGRQLSRLWDGDADGTVDSIDEYTYFDDGGHITTFDDGADGDVDLTERLTVSADGTVTTLETDEDGDGVIDRSFRRTFDDDGREVERATDEGNDGTFEEVQTASYTASGGPLEVTIEANGDGEPEVVTTYAYDDEDRLLSVETWTSEDAVGLGSSSGGPWTSVTTYAYAGETTTKTWRDFDAGVLLSSCQKTTVAGDPVELRCDDDGDGRDDSVTTYATCD